MKKFLKQTISLRDKSIKLLLKREAIYNKRSEKWQESEKGNLYLSDNVELDLIVDNLKYIVKTMEEIS